MSMPIALRPHMVARATTFGAISKRMAVLLICLSVLSRAAYAQRVLECHFVSVTPSSFHLDAWSFAADITGGHLVMLLTRPASDDPFVTAFSALREGVSVSMTADDGSDRDTKTAEFELATISTGNRLVIDRWRFGGTNEYSQLTLTCPSHP